jgi:1,4-dihydroxy-2-naphthoyl-CoA synthase
MRSTASLRVLATYAKPTVSAIRGFCIGGGMQVAMLTDIRIAIAMELIFQSIAKLKGVEASVIRNQAIATQLMCMSRGDEAERPTSMAVGNRYYIDDADLPRGHQQ